MHSENVFERWERFVVATIPYLAGASAVIAVSVSFLDDEAAIVAYACAAVLVLISIAIFFVHLFATRGMRSTREAGHPHHRNALLRQISRDTDRGIQTGCAFVALLILTRGYTPSFALLVAIMLLLRTWLWISEPHPADALAKEASE